MFHLPLQPHQGCSITCITLPKFIGGKPHANRVLHLKREFLCRFSSSRVSSLRVDFQVFNNGPSHVAGLIVTTDFWKTSHVVTAAFQGFGAGFEFWRATFQAAP